MTPTKEKIVRKLGDVVESIFTGINPKRFSPGPVKTRSLPLINVRDIQQGAVADLAKLQTVELPESSQLDRFKVRHGDVLISARGISKVAPVREEHEGCVIGPNIIVVRPAAELEGALILAFLQHAHTQKVLSRSSVGTTVPTLTVKAISELRVALPSYEEQRKLSRLVSLSERQLWAVRRAAESRRLLAQELVMKRMAP